MESCVRIFDCLLSGLEVLFLIVGAAAFAQEQQPIKMIGDYPDDSALTQLLQFQNIELSTVTFKGGDLKNRNYYIIAKEIWKGKLKDADTLFSSANIGVGPILVDSLRFTIISGKCAGKSLKISFRFEDFGMVKEFRSTKSTDYSLRTVGEALKLNQANFSTL